MIIKSAITVLLSLAQKRGEMANMNQETGRYDNTGNLYPIAYTEHDTNSYSIRLL
jgi:hypothetical protein